MADKGRPSTYNQDLDYAQMATDYLQTCSRNQTKLPKVSEFCRETIKADEDTVSEWCKGENIPKEAKVSHLIGAIKRVKVAQREQLMDDGMYGGKEVNNAMAIFLLKANHGMIESDRHIVETKGSLLDLDDNGKTDIHTVSTVPAETN